MRRGRIDCVTRDLYGCARALFVVVRVAVFNLTSTLLPELQLSFPFETRVTCARAVLSLLVHYWPINLMWSIILADFLNSQQGARCYKLSVGDIAIVGDGVDDEVYGILRFLSGRSCFYI